MELSVRPAHPDDADQIAAAHIDGWRVGYRHIVPAEFLDSEDFARVRIEGWRRWTWPEFAPGSELFVAVADDAVIGFGHAGPNAEQPTIGEVYGFYLHSRAWGSGAADLLMQRCLTTLRDRAHDTAVLWVLRDNPRARRFYERHGWRPTGRTDVISTVFAQVLPAPIDDVEYAIALSLKDPPTSADDLAWI